MLLSRALHSFSRTTATASTLSPKINTLAFVSVITRSSSCSPNLYYVCGYTYPDSSHRSSRYFSSTAIASANMEPPKCTQKPKTLNDPFGEPREDPFFWLREKKNPDVLEYLNQENEYADKTLMIGDDEKALYDEFLSRIQETDESVPYKKGDFVYYYRTVKGQQYRIYCRKALAEGAPEQVILDVNELGEGKKYCALSDFEVSPNGKLLAYTMDFEGGEDHTLFVKDLESGKLLSDSVDKLSYGLEWGKDNETLFYTTKDHAERADKLWRHKLGTSATDDVIVYHETDERFEVSVSTSMNGEFIFMSMDSAVTSEVHFVDANKPEDAWTVFLPRVQDVEYQLEAHGQTWLLVTNSDNQKNFKFLTAPMLTTHNHAALTFTELIPHRMDVKLDSVMPFEKFLVLAQRKNGLRQFQVMPVDDGKIDVADHFIAFPEPCYSASFASNYEFKTDEVRVNYSSFITPQSTFTYNMGTRALVLLKEQPVLGDYDRTLYTSERLEATAEDGTKIPISIVKRKDTPQEAPMLLYGYGAYGINYDPNFSSLRLSLLDRGLVCGIAHVRGGGDLGRYWHEAGKLRHKKNTFTDFLSCCEHVSTIKLTNPKKLAVYGASAGGLLMGSILAMRGDDLFSVCIARVPFVDLMSTMLDKDLPLTIVEWEEWGNPNNEEDYKYMRSYSPYDNLTKRSYPATLIKAGLNDPRVQYWEPAKFCARMRLLKTNDSVLAMKTNMGAGHFGSSGRYDHLKEDATEYAFVLKALQIPMQATKQ